MGTYFEEDAYAKSIPYAGGILMIIKKPAVWRA